MSDQERFVKTTGGKGNPKQIHIAHRKSPSELTNLMIEQFTLQKQAENDNSGGSSSSQNQGAGSFLPQPPNVPYQLSPNSGGRKGRSHSRSGSAYYNNNDHKQNTPATGHRRTGSQTSVYGHSRRQSIGLNEAKRAAAEEQAKRESCPHIKVDNPQDIPKLANENEQTSYKFPGSPPPTDSKNNSHRRTQSNMSPNRAFQFPPAKVNQKENNDDFIPVGTPHRRTNSRNEGIDGNWRVQQQQQMSPFYHSRTHSREFSGHPGLEPPPIFQPGHKSRGSNASTHSFNSANGQQQQNSNGRKSLFAPYLPQANIPQLIEEGKLVAGILRVNKKNRSDAWVSTNGVLDADIFICGSKDRNRALEGDLVAVELLLVDDVWESKKEKEEKKRRKDASAQQDIIPLDSKDDYHNDASTSIVSGTTASTESKDTDNTLGSSSGSIKRRGSLKQRPTQKKNDDVEVEGQSLLLVEEEEINDDYKPLYAGHVVAVLDRIPGQLFSGTLGLLRPSQQANNDVNKPNKPKIVWFKPTDKKVPLIAIPIEQAPKDFVENADKYQNKVFVASIKRWPITSLHPFGTLVSQLGELNDPKTEIDAILRDNNFLSDEYLDPRDRTKERDSFQPVILSQEETNSRRLYENVIAISETGELSNYSVHLRDTENGNIELGFHVVDVTLHIEESSSLDRRARKRSSAVFMPQTTVHLLPASLNEFLSLQPDKISNTLSVVYELHPENFDVISTWIGETRVKPTTTLTHERLNQELEKPASSRSKFVDKLESVARNFHHYRLNSKTADLYRTLPLLESLDDEKVKPDLNILQRSKALALLSEIERKVNNTVATRLFTSLGDVAFLRRQPEPISTKLKTFQKKVEKLGVPMDVMSSESVLNSILAIDDDITRMAIELFLSKTLTPAKYFISGKVEPDQFAHYSLNLPLYTHFTAPLRRYSDHVVHRQLKSIINGSEYKETVDALKITSEYCNFKKDCAHHAQEQAIHLLLCKTTNDMGNQHGQILTLATVLQVYESSFDVFIPELGIEKRVHGDQLPLVKAEFDMAERVLELYWKKGVDSATFVPTDEQNPKSYRNSIKNKFNSSSKEIAVNQSVLQNKLVSEEFSKELKELNLIPPTLKLPKSNIEDALEKYLEVAVTRQEGDNNIQEIRELQQVPILLRAEIGMALPCLTVRALNPFMRS
ncbi:protein SSD1 [Kluyveromyces marxianus]|uniref:Protein SSD1 n=2 Tax=Kluyveromyces marxianus TaxID=4911 RepID=W0T9I6_KLUMD|nr:protein SSD1 [Kluyveromyces marxianus DMKU3-1042]QGN15432.1 protein SSD1 [Kluyveromyces marxianus]BAO39718.1 protein SSD1 [Kluyveromyces marxianus DMKU3-1042]BAP71202.1 protein SSD1 [Kluyveromyces marxianus]